MAWGKKNRIEIPNGKFGIHFRCFKDSMEKDSNHFIEFYLNDLSTCISISNKGNVCIRNKTKSGSDASVVFIAKNFGSDVDLKRAFAYGLKRYLKIRIAEMKVGLTPAQKKGLSLSDCTKQELDLHGVNTSMFMRGFQHIYEVMNHVNFWDFWRMYDTFLDNNPLYWNETDAAIFQSVLRQDDCPIAYAEFSGDYVSYHDVNDYNKFVKLSCSIYFSYVFRDVSFIDESDYWFINNMMRVIGDNNIKYNRNGVTVITTEIGHCEKNRNGNYSKFFKYFNSYQMMSDTNAGYCRSEYIPFISDILIHRYNCFVLNAKNNQQESVHAVNFFWNVRV